ncbi:hypothetical protein [Streptomyces sp. CB02923]|uniref:hypothetical protein n=1 Tax=Streptomyces sp. CB02923 TaxID=1718985 RepID=UPI0018FFBBDC|nr:hypothetical protein [Streptomyces sp. CB02923]
MLQEDLEHRDGWRVDVLLSCPQKAFVQHVELVGADARCGQRPVDLSANQLDAVQEQPSLMALREISWHRGLCDRER